VDGAVRNSLRQLATRFPCLYLDELRQKLLECTGVLLHTSTIHKVLQFELGWTLKVVNRKAKERNEAARAAHHAVLREVTDDPKQFVFMDETAKDANASRKRRGWAPKGKPCSIDGIFSDRFDFRYSLLAAADINGFIPEACELVRRKRTSEDRDPDAGTVDCERFEAYVQYSLAPVLGNYWMGEPRSIVVMDNASTHGHDQVKHLIEARGAILIYQAPYSPDMNPIEFCFHQYKAHLKRHHWEYWREPFVAHARALGCVNKQNMINYYRKVGGINGVEENINTDDADAMALMLLLVATQNSVVAIDMIDDDDDDD
jgi:transposase